MVVKVGILEDLILSLQSIVCVHTKNEAFTAECPCPFLEIEERVYGCDKIEFCLVVKYQLSVSLIHRNQVLIIHLFFFFFCIPYNDSTMFFETNIAALGSEPRQNLLSKP